MNCKQVMKTFSKYCQTCKKISDALNREMDLTFLTTLSNEMHNVGFAMANNHFQIFLGAHVGC